MLKELLFKHVNRFLVNLYARRKCRIKRNVKNTKDFVSIIILSFNRVEDTIICINSVRRYVKNPFEIIILDNGSDTDELERLKRFIKTKNNIKLIVSEKNLGCAGGRVEAVKYAKGDYYLFLDNDIVITPFFLENLLETINMDNCTVACSSMAIYPDLTVQFNGGCVDADDKFYCFNLIDAGKEFWDETIKSGERCYWVPGGTTLWKAKFFKNFPIDKNMMGSFEDNEVCVRINNAGYNVRSCAKAISMHYHINFKDFEFRQKERKYVEGRYDGDRIKKTLRYFWKKHHKALVFDVKEATYGFLGKDLSDEVIFKFLTKKYCDS